VKRYSQNSVTLLLQEKTDGEWVRWEDVDTLVELNKYLIERLSALKAEKARGE